MGSFFHRHPGLTPYLLLAPGVALARDLLPRPARLPRLPVAAVGGLPDLRVHVGVLELHGGVLRLPRAALPLVPLRGDRDGRVPAARVPARVLDRVPGGPWRNLFLLFIIAPFFVTYLIRTLAWLNILADEGPVVGFLRGIHVLDEDGRLLATTFAVVSRDHLQLLPLHGAAAVRLARADRRAAAGGGEGSLREPDPGVPPRDAAALRARDRRRDAPDVHSRCRGLHQRRAPRDARSSR